MKDPLVQALLALSHREAAGRAVQLLVADAELIVTLVVRVDMDLELDHSARLVTGGAGQW